MDFSEPSQIIGFVEVIAEGAIVGWAFDPQSESPLRLELVIDGEAATTGVCDGHRPDVMASGFDRDLAGFRLAIPAKYNDDLRHTAELFTPDGRLVGLRDVGGVERTDWGFTFARQSVIARIDPWTGRNINCWALIKDNQTGEKRPAEQVVVRQLGRTVATLVPTVSRPDIAADHQCAAQCGFLLPWRDLLGLDRLAPLHFHVAPDGQDLVGSPLDISALEPLAESALPDPSPAEAPQPPATLESIEPVAPPPEPHANSAPSGLQDSVDPVSRFVGFVEVIAAGAFVGWAFDPRSEPPLTLRLIIDGEEAARGVCDGRRPDVMDAGFDRDLVGFRLEIPAKYTDGAFHTAQLLTPDGRLVRLREIGGVERTDWGFTFARESTIAHVDPWFGRDIYCWALIRDNQTGETRPADQVVVRQLGQTVATLIPTVSRPDIAAGHQCAALCGFRLPLRDLLALDRFAPLHFHVPLDDTEMEGSPLDISTLTFEAGAPDLDPSQNGEQAIARKVRGADLGVAGPSDRSRRGREHRGATQMTIFGHLEGVDNGVVGGWAYDAAEPGLAVRVTVLVDGEVAATIEADAYRMDLEAAGFGDGRHAFLVRLPRSFIRHGASVSVLAGDDLLELKGGPLMIDLGETLEAEAAPALPRPPEPPTGNAVELHQRFVRGLSAWGRSAFEALPAFIDDALTSTDPDAPPRRLTSNLTEIVKEICATHPVIELPFLAAPKCSIIIPAYNNFEITYACIKSLVATGAAEIAEIILADDVSNDAVVFLGSLVTNLRVCRNAENLGFLLNCNRAAKMARGDILLFLNNDTIAQPGWLQECLATFDRFNQVGIVGSRLLYDDGVLQEAGGIIWADGSAWNFGNRGDGNAPEFNYVREVDYVTGASMAIRRDLFEHFGGFDEHYVPAYCEDSDICLKASSEGWRVLYQPFSRLIHLEGKSHGQDVKKGVKAYQVRNSEKLFERWKGYIADNGPNGSKPWMNKDRRHVGRALVLDLVTPTPDKDAGSIATYEQMLILRDLGYKISFIPEDNFAHVGAPTQRLQAEGIECVYGPYVQSVDEWLEKYGSAVDLVHVYRYNVLSKHWQTIKHRVPHAKVVYSNADMHFIRMERQAQLTGDSKLAEEAARVKTIELDLHKRADYSIVTSNVEVNLLDAEAPGTPVKLLRWIAEVVERNPVRKGRDAIAFLGGYQHTPNVDAVDYFMGKILPMVVERTPETRFLICGSAMPERFQDYVGPNVEVVGFVPDLVPLFARCVATVAPIRFGAGFKGKVATSLSHGVPCVGTAIALEGMGFEEGEGVVEAETPEAFSSAIAALYREEATWHKLATRGIMAIDRLYSRDSAMRLWSQILTDIGLPVRHREAAMVATS